MDINASPAALIYQNLRKDFQKGITEANTVADKLYETVPSTSDSNVYGWLSHIPGFKLWHTGQPRVFRNVETFDYTVANQKYEDTLTIDVDKVDDNQLSSYAGAGKAMGAAAKQLYDQLVFDLFNNAFSGTTTYDGLSWINTSHKAGLSTVNNHLGTVALSQTNLEAAIATLKSFTTKPDKASTARPLNPVADKLLLVCSPTLEPTALRIVAREKVEGGDDNILYKKVEVMSTSYITSSTAWFVLNLSSTIKPVILQERMKPVFRNLTPQDSDMGFVRDIYVYGGKARLAALPTLPWLIVGSTGA